MHLELLTKQVVNTIRAVTSYLFEQIEDHESIEVTQKSLHNYVTNVDINLEKRLVTALGRILPEAGFIAEESNDYPRKEKYNWIIDPLDGTTNFIHGIPMVSVSVALLDVDKIVSGIVYDPLRKEAFYAWWGGPAYLNEKVMSPSKVEKTEEALVATGFPYEQFDQLDAYMDLLKYLIKHTSGIRRIGSAALDLAYVAAGRFDAFFEYGLKPWDVAAGIAILRSAGCKISDFSGGEGYFNGSEILAGNIPIFDALQPLVIDYFYGTKNRYENK